MLQAYVIQCCGTGVPSGVVQKLPSTVTKDAGRLVGCSKCLDRNRMYTAGYTAWWLIITGRVSGLCSCGASLTPCRLSHFCHQAVNLQFDTGTPRSQRTRVRDLAVSTVCLVDGWGIGYQRHSTSHIQIRPNFFQLSSRMHKPTNKQRDKH